ncbi:MAG: hypothetical protein HOL32_07210 [Octadecabacter sp.]|jgi:hypothetical protein|nr:hypothetical protein [Octadecabacter sp.]MDB0062165.1 hypothetical protein [Octadecabacter sp.]MDC1381030.1 hypothetical protein [Octadecabacter sp.]MDC1397334.1 hypothetical protein [Octadecabacter sp.]MDG1407321.1 hypothetical protein [Octadecabacter sp.]|tara:strand:+ start:3102 stop:3350 length:249 start_codon:yes stop_codon:yes gene_type:complete
MSTTNSLTADAATQTAVSPIRPLLLIGLFRNATSDYVLVQPLGGDIVRLSVSVPTAGLRLISLGDGFAVIEDSNTIHRVFLG